MEQFKEDMAAQLPTPDKSLNLLKMIESRILEITQVEREIKKKYPKSFQQRLPRFMRRRAASHTPRRIPKKLRPTKFNSKERRKLYMYRLRIRYQKHKRILAKYRRHQYKDPNKSVLHKWFAKRFKMNKITGLEQVPLHNNTKNQRNLYRQTLSGCAYLSFAHLISIKINLPYETATLEILNKLTLSIAGFTFSARSLESGNYEVAVHLFKPSEDKSTKEREFICPALVSNRDTHLLLWVAREKLSDVQKYLDMIEVPHITIMPRGCVRVRLVGPDSRTEAMKISEEPQKLKEANEDVNRRLPRTRDFGVSIGRLVSEKNVEFVLYQTKPKSVDVIIRDKPGRLLWHKLVKNKAHLVGGWRDVNRLLTGSCFELKPDHCVNNP